MKLKRLLCNPTPRGETWPIGWQTLDGRFEIEEQKFHGSPVWWRLRDTSGKRKLSVHEREHDTLHEAKECIQLILNEEAGIVD